MLKTCLRGFLLLSFLVLSACAVAIPEEDWYITLAKRNTQNGVVTITEDDGGLVYPRIHYIENVIEARNQSVRIIAPECISACTMYLGVSNVCTAPYTRFMFHGPWDSSVANYTETPAFQHTSRAIARYYPAPIRRAFMKSYRHLGPYEFHTITGEELIAAGHIRAC
ncbi:MAG: hypothetical protein VX730_07925 [Pseudomonadota bacterium]|nr:hypothetical protein [Pseudomonadota bacterium]